MKVEFTNCNINFEDKHCKINIGFSSKKRECRGSIHTNLDVDIVLRSALHAQIPIA
ncbi:hypothetical protein T11_3841, partial [Trichinella zimbabwensis]